MVIPERLQYKPEARARKSESPRQPTRWRFGLVLVQLPIGLSIRFDKASDLIAASIGLTHFDINLSAFTVVQCGVEPGSAVQQVSGQTAGQHVVARVAKQIV